MEDFLPKPLGSAVMNRPIMIRKQLQGIYCFFMGCKLFYRTRDLDILRRLRAYMEENVETME
jgi:hypothetical protein